MEEENKPKRHYKVEVGDKVKVNRREYDRFVFYKIALPKKNADGTISFFEKNVSFPSGTDLPDGTTIIVKDFFEDVFARKNDKFHANWTLFISDFEIIDNSAFQDYNQANAEFDIDELGNDDLPF